MTAWYELLRAVAWKMSNRTLVYADWDGFTEMALSGTEPAGLLRWCARMLSTVGTVDGCWWVPYALPACALGIVLHRTVHGGRRFRFLPLWLAGALAAAVLPLFGIGFYVWDEPEPAFAVLNLLGLTVGCILFAAWRRLARRMPAAGPWLALLAGCALFMPFGLYATASGAVAFWRTFARRRATRSVTLLRLAGVLAALLTVPALGRFLYGDLSPAETFRAASGLRVWRATPCALGRQLAMERCILRNDFAGVLAVAERGGETVFRLEAAYRILAQYRLGHLPDELFRYPIPSHHDWDRAEEDRMDGYVLLFQYGFMLPAQQLVFDRLSASGWEPEHLRHLGDIAFVCGERKLARRYYAQLARCPFRRAFARARLEALAAPGLAHVPDLERVAEAYGFWSTWCEDSGDAFYRLWEAVEPYIYNRFRRLRKVPESMARMSLAASLLCLDEKKLAENAALLDRFAPPPEPWPVAVQEALLERPSGTANLRVGAIERRIRARHERWKADSARVRDRGAAAQAFLQARYGDTYWFYKWSNGHPARE